MARKFDEEDNFLPCPINPIEYITKEVQHSISLSDSGPAESYKFLPNIYLKKKSCDLFWNIQ